MQPSPLRDLIVGIFVIAGFLAVAYLSVSLGGVSVRGGGHLNLYAAFDEIGGLSPRAQVVIGGVTIGQVEDIALDDDFRARVHLRLRDGLELPTDTSAQILTSGVLGNQYVALQPGGEDDLLTDGDEITFTQSAIVLERLIGKVVQNLGGD